MDAGKRANAAKRTGRRPGSADTRSEILAAARAEFASRGYEKATVRGIARAANVDSALVHHYFGSKDRVFLAAMEFPIDPSAILDQVSAGDPAHVGERLARLAVTLWEVPEIRDRMVAMLRAVASNDEMAALLREFARTMLVGRIAALLPGPEAELRVELAVSQIIGLAMTRYVIRIEPVASAEPEALIGFLAPVLQRHLVP
jgi:AcrR family transcriptional regulator